MAFLMERGDRWRPVKKDKMTDRQWKNLVNSGGNVDENGKVWYPNEGGIEKHPFSCLARGIPTGWKSRVKNKEEMKSWLRPVLLSIVKSKKGASGRRDFQKLSELVSSSLSCESLILNDERCSIPGTAERRRADVGKCKECADCQLFLFDAGDDAICLKSGKERRWPSQR